MPTTEPRKSRLRRRAWGGYEVIDVETGKYIGWVVKVHRAWFAYRKVEGSSQGARINYPFTLRLFAVDALNGGWWD